jgi:hypothetical protein
MKAIGKEQSVRTLAKEARSQAKRMLARKGATKSRAFTTSNSKGGETKGRSERPLPSTPPSLAALRPDTKILSSGEGVSVLWT